MVGADESTELWRPSNWQAVCSDNWACTKNKTVMSFKSKCTLKLKITLKRPIHYHLFLQSVKKEV